jgi:methylthioribose-1-phosphate isomerase
VEIEIRDPAEVVEFGGTAIAPKGTRTLNYAFDVTPAALVTAIVTEDRLIRPDRGERPDQARAEGVR